MLTVTEQAVEAIRRIRTVDHDALRIVVSRGCTGLSYAMGLEGAAEEGDEVLDFAGVRVLIDAASMLWLTGATLDFVENGADSGFTFDNPNATLPPKGCSCATGTCA